MPLSIFGGLCFLAASGWVFWEAVELYRKPYPGSIPAGVPGVVALGLLALGLVCLGIINPNA